MAERRAFADAIELGEQRFGCDRVFGAHSATLSEYGCNPLETPRRLFATAGTSNNARIDRMAQAAGTAMDRSFDELPHAAACRRIDFDFVELRPPAQAGGGPLLVVSGIKRWADLSVTLEPLAYRERPDFWAIEVVGRLAASGMPAMVDFCVAMPLGAHRGRRGIDVVGATRTARRSLNEAVDADPDARATRTA